MIRSSSTTRHAKKVPDTTSYWDAHHILSITIPTCQRFLNRLSIFSALSHDPTIFATVPIGSVTGLAPAQHQYKVHLAMG